MKIKIKEDLRSGDKSFKKDQVVDVPELPGAEKQLMQSLVQMGFAEEVTTPKAKASE